MRKFILIKMLLIMSSLFILTACDQATNEAQDLEQLTKKWQSRHSDWSTEDIATLARGELLYRGNCSACHKRDGSGELTIGAPPLSKNPLLHRAGDDTIKRVLNSRPGSIMPAFGESLPSNDIAAIISYCANEWDNRLGRVIKAEQVEKLR